MALLTNEALYTDSSATAVYEIPCPPQLSQLTSDCPLIDRLIESGSHKWHGLGIRPAATAYNPLYVLSDTAALAQTRCWRYVTDIARVNIHMTVSGAAMQQLEAPGRAIRSEV